MVLFPYYTYCSYCFYYLYVLLLYFMINHVIGSSDLLELNKIQIKSVHFNRGAPGKLAIQSRLPNRN